MYHVSVSVYFIYYISVSVYFVHDDHFTFSYYVGQVVTKRIVFLLCNGKLHNHHCDTLLFVEEKREIRYF
jgi:hypothetical protein